MRFVKTALIAVFILALAVFGVSEGLKLKNRDTTVPKIQSEEDVLEISCEHTEEDLLKGLSASDAKDGDLTDKILVGNFSRFIEKGVCNVNYVVFDSSNQSATLTRKVRFTDYHSPEFTVQEPLVFAEGEGSYTEVMERIGAHDVLDGNLKDYIRQTETDAVYSKSGSYSITLEVENSYGDKASQTLPIHVVKEEETSVDIRLTEGIVYVDAGASVDPYAYIGEVSGSDGKSMDKSSVTVSSGVNTAAPGVYEIAYHAQDDQGNIGNMWLTVVVRG
nr:immunoglobulin-like domain-containing protein [uncultured Sellimonas sp.]